MATKLVKIISNQSGPFNVSNNLVDITLPAYLGACDLSDTCVELNLKMKQSDGTPINDLFDYGFSTQPPFDSTCLIKNVRFSNDKGGTLEEIAQPNVLHANLSPFETDFEARQDDWYYGQSGHRRADGNNGLYNFGTFLDKVDNGTTLSKQRTSLKLPLTSLLGIAKMKQFSNKLFGDCHIHLEFEDNLATVSTLFQHYADNTSYSGVYSNAAKTMVLSDQLVPNQNNIWVGMPVTITQAGGGGTSKNTSVVSISYNPTSRQTTITFADALGTDSAGATFKARASAVANANLTYEIEDVHIIVPQYLLSPAQVNSMESKMKRGVNMQFLTYEVERINMPAITANTQYDRQFDLRSGVINAMMLTPPQNELVSVADNATSFRWRLNGLEQTNRDIVINQSLYNDRLLSVLSSGNIKVRNLSPVSFVAPQSVPLSPEQQVLQIRLNQGSSGSTAKILYLYKQVRRAIKASNTMVQVV